MLKFIQDRHYGAAERMLVIVDRSLHNLIRDAAIVPHEGDEPKAEAVAISCASPVLQAAGKRSPASS